MVGFFEFAVAPFAESSDACSMLFVYDVACLAAGLRSHDRLLALRHRQRDEYNSAFTLPPRRSSYDLMIFSQRFSNLRMLSGTLNALSHNLIYSSQPKLQELASLVSQSFAIFVRMSPAVVGKFVCSMAAPFRTAREFFVQ